ncbi:MAG: hypothetical protein R2731_13510 [Nocardioides sp.]
MVLGELRGRRRHALEPGATFTGATRYPFNDPSVPGLSVFGDGRACNTLTGSFTIHEIDWDPEGTLTKLAVTFEQHCEGGSAALFGSLAWHADNPPAVLPPSLRVATDKKAYRFGQRAVVTATLSADSPLRTVSLYATPLGKPEQLVTTAEVDLDGRLSVKVPVQRRTVFTARFDGQGQFPDRQASKTVTVSAKVVSAVQKYPGRSGKYNLFRASKTAWMRTTVSPNHAGDCLYFRAQFRVGGRWAYPATTPCVHLAQGSWAKVYLPGKGLAGIPVRMRGEWRGDRENRARNSAWRYVKFTKGGGKRAAAPASAGPWPA